MKNLFNKMIILFISIICMVFTVSCGDEADVEYTLKIISSNASLTGYYFCDSSATTAFSQALVDGSAIYEAGQCKNPEHYIEIYAITGSNADNLEAYIYKDGSEVVQYTGSETGDKLYIKQTYEIISTDDSGE
jgi:hypothetical protein